jgi:hypothetical protein
MVDFATSREHLTTFFEALRSSRTAVLDASFRSLLLFFCRVEEEEEEEEAANAFGGCIARKLNPRRIPAKAIKADGRAITFFILDCANCEDDFSCSLFRSSDVDEERTQKRGCCQPFVPRRRREDEDFFVGRRTLLLLCVTREADNAVIFVDVDEDDVAANKGNVIIFLRSVVGGVVIKIIKIFSSREFFFTQVM